jgi:3-methyladenine DNA glycosylase/8-oxoguanine DNA glycosylase
MSTSSFTRVLASGPRFDLAQTVAPVWWSGGRSPSTDWRGQTFYWVGHERDDVVWRTARQEEGGTVILAGTGVSDLDVVWAESVLGLSASLPSFTNVVLSSLVNAHDGFRPWAAGSLYLGFISTIVGQSISLAAAATTEQRLFRLFGEGIELGGRRFWPPPTPAQLADARLELIRSSGVTSVRAAALKEMASIFAAAKSNFPNPYDGHERPAAEELLEVRGIGRWTVQSALLWGIAAPDAHPTGDVALLRAARKHFSDVSDLRSLDRLAESWAPFRGWAARLLWLDLLGYSRD